MSTQARGSAAGRGRLRALVLTIACAAVAIVAATTAFAADAPPPIPSCTGKTLGTKGSKTELTYAIKCSQPITSYSIVTDRSLAGFDVTSLGYAPSGALAPDDQFGCIGEIPSDGFTCNGKAAAHHTVKGTYETDTKACGTSKATRLRSWLVVSTETGVGAGPFPIARQTTCKYPKKKKHKSKSSAAKRSSH